MANNIHKTAIVSPKAMLDENVFIGPYAYVGENVHLKNGVKIMHHASVYKDTTIGENSVVYPFASIGTEPQDLKYAGETAYLEIGKNNTIREYCDINFATGEGEKTVIGNNNLLMAYVHVAHNCIVGNHTVLANVAQLAGHVIIEDYAIIGGVVGVHQFCRIGQYAMVGASAMVNKDIVPYALIDSKGERVRTFNIIGLKRHGFTNEELDLIKSLYRIMFHSKLNTTQALERVRDELDANNKIIKYFIDFVENSQRGILG